jgi:hypothetical protein
MVVTKSRPFPDGKDSIVRTVNWMLHLLLTHMRDDVEDGLLIMAWRQAPFPVLSIRAAVCPSDASEPVSMAVVLGRGGRGFFIVANVVFW